MDRRLSLFSALLLAALLILAGPRIARAHGGHVGPSQTFTQDVGPYELAVTLEMPPTAPAPLYIDIQPPADIGEATIWLRAVPRGQSFANAPVAEIRTSPGPQGIQFTQLDVDRLGDWDLEVRVAGAQGDGVARIPFTIVATPLPAYTLPLLAALLGLIVLMLTSILLATIFRNRQRPVPGWANWLLGQGMFLCLIVAVIFGIQQVSESIQSAQAAAGATATGLGRPHVNALLSTEPAAPTAGQPFTLTLDLSDGSTGLPVEDLISHHEALMHLVVVDASGEFFAHLHPARFAPGHYAIALTPDRPGRYTAYMEISRQDSGSQVLTREFEVGGTGAAPAGEAPAGLGSREVDGLQIDVTSSLTPLKAGRQATLTFSLAADGTPANDIQPWLGMAGHLLARSADGAVFAHIHAAEAMAPGGVAGTGIRYGPDIRFAYTFPEPGRYHLWAQFKRADKIITVPMVVDVEP
jgi:hypothetical protein